MNTPPCPLTGASTTLSDSELHIFELQHPVEIARMRHEEVRGEDFLNHGTYARQREASLTSPSTFVLQEAVGQRGQDDVALPARQTAAFEVVETEFVFQFLILLLDRPALVRQLDDRAQRRGRGQVHQVV